MAFPEGIKSLSERARVEFAVLNMTLVEQIIAKKQPPDQVNIPAFAKRIREGVAGLVCVVLTSSYGERLLDVTGGEIPVSSDARYILGEQRLVIGNPPNRRDATDVEWNELGFSVRTGLLKPILQVGCLDN